MERIRPLLTTYAYNITGCIDEAKDIVQDVFLKYIHVDDETIQNPEAYIKRMVVNHAINFKKKHRKLIRDYPGEWLPEPVAAETADGSLLRKELLSYTVMVMLEKLNARQRAVFILKEAFGYEHTEIAETLGITEENSRQLLSRAKKQVRSGALSAGRNTSDKMVKRYLDVLQRGDTERLIGLLTEDITIISDGGGKASTGINPIHGIKNAVAYLQGIYRKFYQGYEFESGWINHQPALLCRKEGKLQTCFIFNVSESKITDLYVLRNPDKLSLLKK